jgi:hypothetical protein
MRVFGCIAHTKRPDTKRDKVNIKVPNACS